MALLGSELVTSTVSIRIEFGVSPRWTTLLLVSELRRGECTRSRVAQRCGLCFRFAAVTAWPFGDCCPLPSSAPPAFEPPPQLGDHGGGTTPDRSVIHREAKVTSKLDSDPHEHFVRVALNPPPLFRINFSHIVELHEQYPMAPSDAMPYAAYQEGGEFVTRNQLGYGDMALNSLVTHSPVFHQLEYRLALGLVTILVVPVSQVSS
jgi:hypothetical protein